MFTNKPYIGMIVWGAVLVASMFAGWSVSAGVAGMCFGMYMEKHVQNRKR